jgi:hypothetical protein
MTDKATAFIRTDVESWKIVNNLPKIDNMPVISVIGTSRDGKSTSLNLYANWIMKNISKSHSIFSWFNSKIETPFIPFTALQTDEIVTNGIDFFVIPNKCMLIDCQGMQLKDAKHDHFLMLITYLISNVIILTVRERLDLQVLNNCLGVFSFLSEIPNEFKRTDKPVLLIRIKDFQNFKQLNKDPLYLKKYVDKWLEKSNDQYDQIKEAFRNTFIIDVIATKYPTMDEDGEVDIHDSEFFVNNPTFLNYCNKLDELCVDYMTSNILKNPDNIIKLVNSLKMNKTIDWKKLDLYHQITENELRKYLQENLLTDETLNDKTIIEEMDGSLNSYEKCIIRNEKILQMKLEVYEKKFKDITLSVKKEVFDGIFNTFKTIYETAKHKNDTLAEITIKPFYDKFTNMYKEKTFSNYFINKIIEYFSNHKEEFMMELKKIDFDVQQKYLEIINKEEIEVENKQKIINENNDLQQQKINKLIEELDIMKQCKENIDMLLQNHIKHKLYNVPFGKTLYEIKQTIFTDIKNIHIDNDITWLLDTNKKIITVKDKLKYNLEEIFNKNIDIEEITAYFWMVKKQMYMTMGFMDASFDFKENIRINFVKICCCSLNFYVIQEFFEKHNMLENIKKQFEKDFNIDVLDIKKLTDDNLKRVYITLKEGYRYSPFSNMLENSMAKYLTHFSKEYKYTNFTT